MRISDWSSDVCSSDLVLGLGDLVEHPTIRRKGLREISHHIVNMNEGQRKVLIHGNRLPSLSLFAFPLNLSLVSATNPPGHVTINPTDPRRSEEHTSELQSLMLSSYAVICLKNKISKVAVEVPQIGSAHVRHNVPTMPL